MVKKEFIEISHESQPNRLIYRALTISLSKTEVSIYYTVK